MCHTNGISFLGFGIPLVYLGIPHTIEIPCKYQIPKILKIYNVRICDVDCYCASTVRLKKRIVHVGQVRLYVNAYCISFASRLSAFALSARPPEAARRRGQTATLLEHERLTAYHFPAVQVPAHQDCFPPPLRDSAYRSLSCLIYIYAHCICTYTCTSAHCVGRDF
jgi:hypothetical protein